MLVYWTVDGSGSKPGSLATLLFASKLRQYSWMFMSATMVVIWQLPCPHSYGPLPVISTYNPICRMSSPIYNQL
jgi:hypothetical protein